MARLILIIEDVDEDRIRIELKGQETIDESEVPTTAVLMMYELMDALASVSDEISDSSKSKMVH